MQRAVDVGAVWEVVHSALVEPLCWRRADGFSDGGFSDGGFSDGGFSDGGFTHGEFSGGGGGGAGGVGAGADAGGGGDDGGVVVAMVAMLVQVQVLVVDASLAGLRKRPGCLHDGFYYERGA